MKLVKVEMLRSRHNFRVFGSKPKSHTKTMLPAYKHSFYYRESDSLSRSLTLQTGSTTVLIFVSSNS